MAYTNSSLVSYTKLSPNHSGQRTHSIDRITPHCVVGQLSADALPALLVRPPATMVSALTAVSPYVLKKKIGAGAPLLIPMIREPSPSNVPLTCRSLMR